MSCRDMHCNNARVMTLQVPLRNPPTPSWIHDFPVTQKYAVLPETPVIFNLKVRGTCAVQRCTARPKVHRLLHFRHVLGICDLQGVSQKGMLHLLNPSLPVVAIRAVEARTDCFWCTSHAGHTSWRGRPCHV